MKFYVAFACLLAVVGVSHGYAIGHIGAPLISAPLLAPAAISTANQWRGAPIPVLRTYAAPVLHAPVIRTVLPYSATAWGNGVWGNGLWGNGIWGNGLWGSGVWGSGLGYGWGRGAWH